MTQTIMTSRGTRVAYDGSGFFVLTAQDGKTSHLMVGQTHRSAGLPSGYRSRGPLAFEPLVADWIDARSAEYEAALPVPPRADGTHAPCRRCGSYCYGDCRL